MSPTSYHLLYPAIVCCVSFEIADVYKRQVYRTYEDGMYRYEDDYGAILMRPAYEEQVRAFAEQYLPSEGIKIYTEIKNGGSGAAEEEAVSYTHLDVYKRQGFCGTTGPKASVTASIHSGII